MSDDKGNNDQNQNVPPVPAEPVPVAAPVPSFPPVPVWWKDYEWYEHFTAPSSYDEFKHRYGIMMRDIYKNFGLSSQDFPHGLHHYVNQANSQVQDLWSYFATYSFSMRYYGSYLALLLPIALFKRRRLRKVFWTYALYAYFVFPDDLKAFYYSEPKRD